MVGSGTVKQDDPLLTCRVAGGKQPARIIVDSALSVSPRARVFTGTERSPVLIATTARSAAEARRRYARRPGIEVVGCPARRGLVDLVALMRALGRRQVTHLLVEGGGTLIASLIDARLVDRMLVFVAPLVIGGHDAPTSVEGAGTAHLVDAARFRFVRIQSFKRDIMIEAERCSPVL